MMDIEQEIADETTLTEITILGDGRIYVFGASAPLLEVLAELCPNDDDFQKRVEHVRATCEPVDEQARTAGSHQR